TRQQLLDAAERLFSERGVSRTTLADIAAAAGLTRGAVYWHFQNKLDLYRAMLARVTPSFDDMREQLLLVAGTDPARALWEHSHRLLAVIEQNPQVRRILLILFLRS
ncbi:TetR family transcriptional regulator, partial [Chromobacterium piscinae]